MIELTKDMRGVKIDLGGIAKGLRYKWSSQGMKAQGIKATIVDAGGIYMPWAEKARINYGISALKPPRWRVAGYIETEDLAVIDPVIMKGFFIKDGKRYHHIFNSKTGYPTEANNRSNRGLSGPDPCRRSGQKYPCHGRRQRPGFYGEKMPGMQAL